MNRFTRCLRDAPIFQACKLVPVLATVGLAGPALAGAAVGPTTPGSAVDWNGAGQAQTWRVQSNATEQVDTLSVFIDSSSSLSSSSRFALGLYSNSSGKPLTRLAQCTINAVVKNTWNRCTFSAVAVSNGATYWTVGLQPAGTPGTVKYRHAVGTGQTYPSTAGTLTSLPSTRSNGTNWGSFTASVYASRSGTAPVPPPPPAPVPPPPPAPVPPPTSTSCDVEVSSRSALLSAVQNTANGGRTVCAHAADYGTAELTLAVRHATKLTLRASKGETVTLPVVVFAGVTNLRVEGFDMPRGGFDTNQRSARNIEMVRNEIHDCFCQALRLWAGDQNVLFEGNYVHAIHYNGGWTTGWGINSTGTTSGLKVRYNTFDGLGNDAMEISDSADGEIVGNVIKHVDAEPGYADPHPDSIMLWAGSKRWLIKDNRISDGRGVLMSGSTSDVRMENNLIVRIKNYCHDGGTTGTSSAGLIRYTWVRNTIWDCGSFWGGGGFGGGYGLLSDGPASANVLDRNLLTDVGYDSSGGGQFQTDTNNLIKSGGLGGTDRTFTPLFADQVDYQATNLPAGYADVGYRPAPAGHTAAP